MCGRFVAASTPDDIANYFEAEPPEAALEPNYNVAPTTDVYAVMSDGGVRRVEAFHWGLVPHWAKDPKVGSRMINARAETLAEKSAFKSAFTKRRVLVPADGFYEWKKAAAGAPKKNKQPYFIHRPDGEPFAFAGLWAVWRGSEDGDSLRSTTIITTEANEAMAPLHDRMPVILPRSRWDEWLDPANNDLDTLGKLLVPAPPELIEAHPVSTDVNNVRNRGPHLMDPIDPDAETLFGAS
jgi:putative SOS response-associated peptidase YedK